jgi:hypothetical protein
MNLIIKFLSNRLRFIFATAMVLLLLAAVLSAGAEEAAQSLSHERYTLEQAVVLSLQNIPKRSAKNF